MNLIFDFQPSEGCIGFTMVFIDGFFFFFSEQFFTRNFALPKHWKGSNSKDSIQNYLRYLKFDLCSFRRSDRISKTFWQFSIHLKFYCWNCMDSILSAPRKCSSIQHIGSSFDHHKKWSKIRRFGFFFFFLITVSNSNHDGNRTNRDILKRRWTRERRPDSLNSHLFALWLLFLVLFFIVNFFYFQPIRRRRI